METRTLLRDFQSHNQIRSVFRVDAGSVVKASKIRLVDFNIYSDISYTEKVSINLHPLAGVYSLVKKMSFLNLDGVEIDNMTNCLNNMAMRLTHMSNSLQEGINKPLNLTGNSFFNQDSSTIVSRVATDTSDGLYIDISFMLNYLSAREYLAEGFTIVVEWNEQSLWFPEAFNVYISNPTLAIDEMIEMNPSQVDMKPVVFKNLVNDVIVMGTVDSKTQRLNSYYNLFLSNLYYLNNTATNLNEGLGYSSSVGETFELTIDGKKLLSLKGINTPARKTAYLNDFAGKGCMVNNANQALLNPLQIEILNGVGETIKLDNQMSYGCVKLDRFIQNDMTVSFSRTNTTSLNVSIIAEVLKMYDPSRGVLSFVRQ